MTFINNSALYTNAFTKPFRLDDCKRFPRRYRCKYYFFFTLEFHKTLFFSLHFELRYFKFAGFICFFKRSHFFNQLFSYKFHILRKHLVTLLLTSNTEIIFHCQKDKPAVYPCTHKRITHFRSLYSFLFHVLSYTSNEIMIHCNNYFIREQTQFTHNPFFITYIFLLIYLGTLLDITNICVLPPRFVHNTEYIRFNKFLFGSSYFNYYFSHRSRFCQIESIQKWTIINYFKNYVNLAVLFLPLQKYRISGLIRPSNVRTLQNASIQEFIYALGEHICTLSTTDNSFLSNENIISLSEFIERKYILVLLYRTFCGVGILKYNFSSVRPVPYNFFSNWI